MVARASPDRRLADLANAARSRRRERLARRRRRAAALARARRGRGAAGNRWPLVAALAAWVVGVLALAGPAWERLPVPAFRSEEALVVALDLSRSMDASDVEPSRLERAKLKLLDLLDRRAAGQTALIVFSTHAFTVTPLTTDTRTIASLVNAVDTDIMPTQGGSLEAGLTKAAAAAAPDGSSRRRRAADHRFGGRVPRRRSRGGFARRRLPRERARGRDGAGRADRPIRRRLRHRCERPSRRAAARRARPRAARGGGRRPVRTARAR